MVRITLLCVFCVGSLSLNAQKITSAVLGGYEARQIGPAVMSGRITAIEVFNNNPRTIYVGTAGGGIWKSTSAGSVFKPVFDKYNQSIGALALDQKNPEIIWAGTGESNMRNSVSVGDGLYRSEDGGDHWVKVGLDSTEHISKIVIHPGDGNTVYVAAPGPLWSSGKQRGLFKTTDGGQTWSKILYIDENTGCADVIVDPSNPEIVYASTWQFRRSPWSFTSGGPGSALYKSTNGGKTWKKIQKGFLGDELGRICLAISPSKPENLYAIAESQKTALYRSTDGGESWVRKSGSQNVTWRPFYFSVIMVDPKDPQRIYRPALNFSISNDGGESFTEASFEGGWVHSDHHALWINPNNTNHLLLGTDGGVYQSLDRGNSWKMFDNLPVSQFYHVSADLQEPYKVYGGLQDNGSWYAPSKSESGIENRDWNNCGGGDGFWVQPDLLDSNIIYSESQGGNVVRFNKRTLESKDIKPYPASGDPKLRFNWNTPIVMSPTDKTTLYVGAQFLYRSKDRGDSWERISGDLTTNDPKKQQQEKSGGLSVDNSGAENHCTIFTICESAKDPSVIWVGTDDGNVQVTENGGKSWVNVTKNIKGIPPFTWCSNVQTSAFDRNTVFATFDGHATGDLKTYVFKSSDLGKTWTSLATDDVTGYAHKITQDFKNPSLLYLGTENGLFISFDSGKSWSRFNADVPPVAVRDIVVHPKTNDLILATHGRGIIILDDLSPLQTLPDVLKEEMAFLPVRPQHISVMGMGGFPSSGYMGDNPPSDLVISYYLKDRISSGDLKIEILDNERNLITTIPANKRKGINRVYWNMRMKPPKTARGVKIDVSAIFGPPAPEGEYIVRLIRNEKSIEKTFSLRHDPKSPHTADDRKIRAEAEKRIFNLQEDLAYLAFTIRAASDSVNKQLSVQRNPKAAKAATAFKTKVNDLTKEMVASIEGTHITGEEKLREKIGMLYLSIVSYQGRPTKSQLERINGLEKEFNDLKAKADVLMNSDLANLDKLLGKPVTRVSREYFNTLKL